MDVNITLSPDDTAFEPASRWSEEECVDTSWRYGSNPIGKLRLDADNARQGWHPVLNEQDESIGRLVGIAHGYTHHCVYSDLVRGFLITREPIPTSKPMGSSIGIVQPTGRFFLRSKGEKSTMARYFVLPPNWPSSAVAFKLIDGDKTLFFLAEEGFCCLNLSALNLDCLVEFEVSRQASTQGFALSPKVKLLAIPFSYGTHRDPVTGETVYRNLVRIYNLNSGRVVGEAPRRHGVPHLASVLQQRRSQNRLGHQGSPPPVSVGWCPNPPITSKGQRG